jgi:DNA-binding transcriptional regulator GbsR (MarR family)
MDMSKPRAYVINSETGEKKMIYLDEREDYLAKGWHRPGMNQVFEDVAKTKATMENVEPTKEVTKEAKEDMNEFLKSLDFDDVKNDASDLSAWLNAKYGLETNYRQGLKKLTEIANDNSAKDNREGS